MAVAHKFIVADDHPLFRAALTQALRQLAPQAEIVEADTMEATTEVVNRHPDADLILLDLHMPGAHGFPSYPAAMSPTWCVVLSTTVPLVLFLNHRRCN